MVSGGVADETKDLKNSPTRSRIRRMVKGSIRDMSWAAPVDMSYIIAVLPVR